MLQHTFHPSLIALILLALCGCVPKQTEVSTPALSPHSSPQPAPAEEKVAADPVVQAQVQRWIRVLKQGTTSEQRVAAEALGRLGPRAEAAIPALTESFAGPNRWTFDKDGDSAHPQAAEALARIGSAAVPALVAILKDPSNDNNKSSARHWAASVLGRMGPGAKAAVPALIEALKDRNVWVSAAIALRDIGPEAKGAVPALLEALKVKDYVDVPLRSAEALWRICRHPDAVPPLLAMLKGRPDWARPLAAESLWRMDRHPAALPSLVQSLRRKGVYAEERIDAVRVLREIGPAARSIVPALEEALQDEEPCVRLGAAEVLWWVDRRPASLTLLIKTLKYERSDVRGYAAHVLGTIGPDAKVAVPALVEAIQDKESEVRRTAANSLLQIDPDTAKKLNLRERLRNGSIELRRTVP